MENDLKIIKIIFFLITAFVLAACSSGPENLSTAKENVIVYYKSGKFDKELNSVIGKAIDKFEDFHPAHNDAVVFDIDETVLSNYEFNKECDFGYDSVLWDNWVAQAKAPPMKSVRKLYDFFLLKNLKIIFITGRNDSQYKATYKNLLTAGYNKFDTLIVRKSGEYNLTALQYKSEKRAALTRKGYSIVCDIGDQFSDLDGPDHGVQVKIPNYMYIIK